MPLTGLYFIPCVFCDNGRSIIGGKSGSFEQSLIKYYEMCMPFHLRDVVADTWIFLVKAVNEI